VADARGRAFRKTHAKGVADVRQWIGKWWGDDTSDLAIRELNIPVPQPSTIKRYSADEAFRAAFRNKRDSDLHSVLKYAAWTWLNKEKTVAMPYQSELVWFEQQIFFPQTAESEFKTYYHPLGGEFDQTKAQVIRRGDNEVSATEGLICTIDVYGKGTNIEVGNTQPLNLLSPLVWLLSKRAVWFPYPTGLRPANFELKAHGIRTVTAYEITHAKLE